MSKRNRNDRGALVALSVIVGGAILSAFFGFLEQAQRQPDYKPNQERSADVDPDAYNGWRDTYAQWAMMVLAAGGTGVGIWTIILLQKTIKVTRKGNRINRSIGEAQVRAYIEIERVSIEFVQRNKLFAIYSPDITISVINNGSSPALNFTWVPTVSYGFSQSSCRMITGPTSGLAHYRSIPPTREAIQLPSAELSDTLSYDEDAAMWVGSMKAFVAVGYEFTDVFGKTIAEEVYFSGMVESNEDMTVFRCDLERSIADDGAAASYTESLHRQALARALMREQMQAAADDLSNGVNDEDQY